jgi:DNA-binding transcriptional ArsR family regulator
MDCFVTALQPPAAAPPCLAAGKPEPRALAGGEKNRLDISVSYGLPLAMAYGNTLAVLADPTRRRVFERLRAGPRPVNILAAGLPVSRPAVSQHLKALKDAGLVEERSEGVRRIYSVRREGLMELREWLDSFWGEALEAFKLEAERSHKGHRRK